MPPFFMPYTQINENNLTFFYGDIGIDWWPEINSTLETSSVDAYEDSGV